MNRFPVQPFFMIQYTAIPAGRNHPELPAAILILNIPAERTVAADQLTLNSHVFGVRITEKPIDR